MVIPDGVTSIGDNAFSGCVSLARLEIGNGVVSIGPNAFYGCKALTNVKIGIGVQTIFDGMFSDCAALTSVTIGNGVKSIGASAFSGCGNLKEVVIPDGITSIGDGAFKDCASMTNVAIGAGVRSIGAEAFYNCAKLADVDIPDSVESIGKDAFYGCGTKPDVTPDDSEKGEEPVPPDESPDDNVPDGFVISNGVTRIDNGAFSGNGTLEEVSFPDSVTSIGDYAFNGCTALSKVAMGSGLKDIGMGAFQFCSSLTEVSIPAGVTNISDAAFNDCSTLSSVVFSGNAPYVGSYAFSNINPDCIVYIPDGASGFIVDSSGKWQGLKVKYYSSAVKPVPPSPSKPVVDPVSLPYGALTESDITDAFAASKATTLKGAVYDGSNVVGIVELKLAKVNTRSQSGRISGSITGLDGKRSTMKAVKVTNIDGVSPKRVSLEVKNLGTMTVTIGGTKFAGTLGGYHVQSIEVGGNWNASTANVVVDVDDLSMFTGEVVDDLLPLDEVANVSGGKWKFARAATVKWTKVKAGVTPLVSDASGYGLVVDTKKGSNLSSMKLTYNSKKGTFNGSFKVYELQGASPRIKLKKYTVKVSGVVVDGVGTGMATCKKPSIDWPVTVSPSAAVFRN